VPEVLPTFAVEAGVSVPSPLPSVVTCEFQVNGAPGPYTENTRPSTPPVNETVPA